MQSKKPGRAGQKQARGRTIHDNKQKRTKWQSCTHLAKGTNQLEPHLSHLGLEFFRNLLVLQNLSVIEMRAFELTKNQKNKRSALS